MPRWDCRCERRYTGGADAPECFGDAVDALEDSKLFVWDESGSSLDAPLQPPVQLELERGRTTAYRIAGAYCRTIAEAERLFGTRWAPYSWVGLMNRYACKRLQALAGRGSRRWYRGAARRLRQRNGSRHGVAAAAAGSTEDTVVIEYPD